MLFRSVTPWNLLNAIQHICDSIRPLLSEDQAIFISNSKSLLIAPKFNISQESIETLLTDQSLIREQEMVLKVKKPDFLGQSMWEMKHGVKSISVKITDQNWLTLFHKQKESVLPGDSLHGLVRHQENIDQKGQLVSESYQILKVWDVKKRPITQQQISLF